MNDQKEKTNFSLAFSRTHIYVVVIFLVALVARIPAMKAHYALGADDGVYGMSAVAISEGARPFKGTFSSQGGYFLELISAPSQIFNNLFWAPRIVPILAGCCIAVCVFFLGKRFMPESLALLAALSCAVSGTLLRTTGPITSDGIVTLVILICILTAFHFIDNPTFARAIVAGIALGFGTQIKNVFMIPVIIFLIALTIHTPFTKRLVAGFSAVIVFVLPFFLYGYRRVWDQSIAYHLEKHDERSLSTNLEKIFTTLSSFDLVYILLFLIATFGFCAVLIRKFRSQQSFFVVIKSLFRIGSADPHNKRWEVRALAIFYFVPAVLLMVVQTPLFRNHLAIIIPVGYVVMYSLAFDAYARRSDKLSRSVSMGITGAVLAIIVTASLFSYIATINNSTFKESRDHVQATRILKQIKNGSIVLTDDPGIAWSTGLRVPQMFTDASRYRFSAETKSIQFTSDSFAQHVNAPNVCAAVQSPLQKPELLNIDEWVPTTWQKAVRGKYTLWINPSRECLD
ncbi:MAG TPA: glycosyltransferase family 39 protein [Acidimicrobiia bacterium]|nr:glycosyltransferase family 39 protein [Acidimicrobiia bacterium]